jgi:hypothetical protein
MDWLAPTTREALRHAEAEARDLRSSHVYPEHLLLGLLLLEGEPLRLLFQANHLGVTQVRRRVQERFKPSTSGGPPEGKAVPLAEEAEECLKRAVMALVVEALPPDSSKRLTPELLALSLFANPRIQHVLAFAATPAVLVHNRLIEQTGAARFQRMERRFLFSLSPEQEERIALQYVDVGLQKRVLKSVEPPLYRFRDLAGLVEPVAREVHALIASLRDKDSRPAPARGLLLVSPDSARIKQFVRAIAGEAGTPLTVVFCSVLAEIWREYGAGKQSRAMLRELYLSLRLRPFSLIYLEDLDTLIGLDEPRELDEQEKQINKGQRFLSLFLEEMDKLLARPGIVLLAATGRPEGLEPGMLAPERLGRGLFITLPETLKINTPQAGRAPKKARPALPASLAPRQRCPACHQPAQEHWRHCIYCGAALARACPNCGSPRPEIEGARFCFHCGHALT